MSVLQGRGLWLGAQESASLTLGSWDALCQQCRRWGISVVHPKVGDGIASPSMLWFTPAFLQNLRHIAIDYYHLQCVPYLYCYGNLHGRLVEEAQAIATIGQIFGGVSPDIEVEWNLQTTWASQMGQLVRQQYGYTGPVYPTVFADPLENPTPIAELNVWVDGFLPQVYFSVWTPPTAQNAINFIYPQWRSIEASLQEKGQVLKPLLPIISLANGVAPQEVSNWLHQMGNYGYCGFWYWGAESSGSSLYEQYAHVIYNAPEPAHSAMPSPADASSIKGTNVNTITSTNAPFLVPTANSTLQIPVYNQQLMQDELEVIWRLYDPQAAIPFNPALAICSTWIRIIQYHPDWFFGSPLHTEQQIVTESGVHYTFQTFSGGDGTCQIWWFPATNKTCIIRGENDPLLIRQAIAATNHSSAITQSTQSFPLISIPATV